MTSSPNLVTPLNIFTDADVPQNNRLKGWCGRNITNCNEYMQGTNKLYVVLLLVACIGLIILWVGLTRFDPSHSAKLIITGGAVFTGSLFLLGGTYILSKQDDAQ